MSKPLDHEMRVKTIEYIKWTLTNGLIFLAKIHLRRLKKQEINSVFMHTEDALRMFLMSF